MRNSLKKTIGLFFLFSFIFLPLNFNGKSCQFSLTEFFFGTIIKHLENVFFTEAIAVVDFSSDTISLNLLLLILFFLASALALILNITKTGSDKIILFSRAFACYYLSFVLLKYGFDKIFKAQFYLPEPNILYTSFGNLSKDILYWSTMGTSHFFSMAMGIIEVITATLILVKSTRVLGLTIAIGVFVNIILINFGFDISVKTFSIFLFLANLFALFPHLKSMYVFFILQKEKHLQFLQNFIKHKKVAIIIKFAVVLWMFIFVLYPYLKSKNFNDDHQERPFLHGVYKVEQITKGLDTVGQKDFQLKNIFIHRNSYLIFQDKNNQMMDYFFEINTIKNQITLLDYQENKIIINYQFSKSDSILTLKMNDLKIKAKAQNWRKMPALQNQSHYFIDHIK